MRKYILFFLVFLFSFPVFAQTARIIDIKGEVSVKRSKASPWERAQMQIFLSKEAELKTETASECTLSFDENLENVITIKGDSQVTLDSIIPGRVYLPRGRVFSLLEGLEGGQTFEVRTPVAIAGARGTGNSTEHGNNGTTVSAFEDTTYVKGLDKDGKVTGEKELKAGSKMEVDEDGNLGGSSGNSGSDNKGWNDFRENTRGVREDFDTGGGSDKGPFSDLQNEEEDSFYDDLFEDRRGEGMGGSGHEEDEDNHDNGNDFYDGPPSLEQWRPDGGE